MRTILTFSFFPLFLLSESFASPSAQEALFEFVSELRVSVSQAQSEEAIRRSLQSELENYLDAPPMRLRRSESWDELTSLWAFGRWGLGAGAFMWLRLKPAAPQSEVLRPAERSPSRKPCPASLSDLARSPILSRKPPSRVRRFLSRTRMLGAPVLAGSMGSLVWDGQKAFRLKNIDLEEEFFRSYWSDELEAQATRSIFELLVRDLTNEVREKASQAGLNLLVPTDLLSRQTTVTGIPDSVAFFVHPARPRAYQEFLEGSLIVFRLQEASGEWRLERWVDVSSLTQNERAVLISHFRFKERLEFQVAQLTRSLRALPRFTRSRQSES